ncbi:MAG: 50S ribosomal protein L24 [Propionibacteriaceae bacterium]|nr:50S ribosomal protein L24 [Propionibacteriaceae bacterium]
MAGMRVRKGDTVKVIAGEDKGAIGEVIAVLPETGKVKVSAVNIVKRHVPDRYNARTGTQTKGGMVSSEAWIDASNVQLVVRDEHNNRVVTRVGSERTEATKTRPDGSTYSTSRGVRIARKTGKEIR